MKLLSINSTLWWGYDLVVNNPLNAEQIQTTCFIESEGGAIRTGVATASSKDVFTKEEGRKRSLKKCISNFPREIRSLIWDEYHSRSGVHQYKKESAVEVTA
jgi:hypothetical protein